MSVIDDRCTLPDDDRERYSRYVNSRPADGAVVDLNPPRFSWPYVPDIAPESDRVPEKHIRIPDLQLPGFQRCPY